MSKRSLDQKEQTLLVNALNLALSIYKTDIANFNKEMANTSDENEIKAMSRLSEQFRLQADRVSAIIEDIENSDELVFIFFN